MSGAPPLFVVGRFPPPIDGQTLGTQRLAELLADRYDVRRASTSAPERGEVAVEVKLRPRRVVHYARLLPRLRRVLHEAPEAPVLWASVSPHPLGHLRDRLTMLPALAPGQPAWAVLHRGTFERLFEHPLTARSARRLADRMTGFVFLNRDFADACSPYLPDSKRHVVPNTVDAALLFSPEDVAAKQAARTGRTRLRVLFLSNLMVLKGYLDVLGAVARLRARGVDVEARFAGRWASDDDRRRWHAAVEADGLEDVVRYEGALSDRTDVRALHAWADAFVLPSYHPTEAMPLSLLEALGAGTPAVVTRHGGLPDVVRDGREGLLVPPRDSAAVADALAVLAEPARWRTLSDGARGRFDARYGPDAVRDRWFALLGMRRS